MPHKQTDPNPTHNLPPNLPTDRRVMLAGIGGLAAGALLAGKAQAGPLTPPAGPIGPTPGPEPRTAINAINTPGGATAVFRISQPGSYYLTGNITGQPGRSGIEVAATGVTIDLMGFNLSGGAGSLDGIRSTVGNIRGASVLNGTISNWGGNGIHFLTPIAGRIDGVTASDNGAVGILAGPAYAIVNCCAAGNGSNGISVERGGLIAHCTAISNGEDGIVGDNGCTVTDCSADGNTGVGIRVGISGTVSNSNARGNTSTGISTDSGSTLTGCTGTSNQGLGINSGNSTTLTNCTASQNTSVGISAGFGSIVVGCTMNNNGSHGAQLSGNCVIRSSGTNSNGASGTGAGIRVFGSDNRVEDNNSADNRIGIECIGAGNFIARNTCSSNITNWVIVANNKCLVVNGVNAAAINGDAGGVSPGSTNPNANYTY